MLSTSATARIGAIAACVAVTAGLLTGGVGVAAGVTPGAAHSPGPPRLTDSAPCPDTAGFSCSTLSVPLDRSGRVRGTLRLRVATADNADAPRGVLLVLSGGPGQPGVSLVNRIKQYFRPEVLTQYRMVMLDQRGTGPAGIDCARLQAEVGGSDFVAPSPAAVRACADQLGPTRDFYGTPDTVADLDDLRAALGVSRMAVDGVSYGTFAAAQYALAHPARVSSLVLDSIVPLTGIDALPLPHLAAAGRVLADACRHDSTCTTDPVADLAWLVRHGRIDGRPIGSTRLLEGLADLSLSTVNPAFIGVPQMLHAARHGDTSQLETFLASTDGAGQPYADLSGGLHLATLCSDLHFPWGRSDAPQAGRQRAIEAAAARLRPAQVYPYDRATATHVLEVSACSHWRSRPSAYPALRTLLPRTLLLAGTHDLFTPLPWAYEERRHTACGRLVVIPGMGHGTQGSRTDLTASNAVRGFLLS